MSNSLSELGYQLHKECTCGSYNESQMLIDQGADIEWKNGNGNTPLMIAANRGYINIVQLLLHKGANINSKNNSGDTALHLTAYRNKGELVRLLIERGIDLHVKNNFGETALDEAFNQAIGDRTIDTEEEDLMNPTIEILEAAMESV